MTRLRLALFDCDGTLVDSQHAIVAAMADAFHNEGLAAPEPASVRQVVGLSLVEAVARLSPGAEPAVHERLSERYKQAFHRQRSAGLHPEPLYPGLRAALDTLGREGVVLGVATGKSRRGLDAVLNHHGLTGRFATLQTADTGPGKPDPDMVFRALAESGAEAADTVMIGDTVYDIEMARRAGVGALGVSWGYHEVDWLRRAGAHRVVDAGDELAAAVLELLAANTAA
jgi:phosphoglycolate phosphatase